MSSVELFLDDDLFNLFTRETNLYYFQQKNNNVNESTKNKGWTNTTIAEMKKFLGLVIIMGIVKKPERDDYWSTHPYYIHQFSEIQCQETDSDNYGGIGTSIIMRTVAES